MNTDRKAILRYLAVTLPRIPRSASEIATACAIGRVDAATNLAGLETAGLATCALNGKWKLTAQGLNHYETRMAA
mgnify:FL=1